MTCEFITIIGGKGGSGKTSSVGQAVYGLARRGEKILVVDLDRENGNLLQRLTGCQTYHNKIVGLSELAKEGYRIYQEHYGYLKRLAKESFEDPKNRDNMLRIMNNIDYQAKFSSKGDSQKYEAEKERLRNANLNKRAMQLVCETTDFQKVIEDNLVKISIPGAKYPVDLLPVAGTISDLATQKENVNSEEFMRILLKTTFTRFIPDRYTKSVFDGAAGENSFIRNIGISSHLLLAVYSDLPDESESCEKDLKIYLHSLWEYAKTNKTNKKLRVALITNKLTFGKEVSYKFPIKTSLFGSKSYVLIKDIKDEDLEGKINKDNKDDFITETYKEPSNLEALKSVKKDIEDKFGGLKDIIFEDIPPLIEDSRYPLASRQNKFYSIVYPNSYLTLQSEILAERIIELCAKTDVSLVDRLKMFGHRFVGLKADKEPVEVC
ncbi:AAA family ATPase [Candidatus Woesearchaeota archaeon]|nr:AAA family ATPase [Candidatus Woesearchaeota archaeon]